VIVQVIQETVQELEILQPLNISRLDWTFLSLWLSHNADTATILAKISIPQQDAQNGRMAQYQFKKKRNKSSRTYLNGIAA